MLLQTRRSLLRLFIAAGGSLLGTAFAIGLFFAEPKRLTIVADKVHKPLTDETIMIPAQEALGTADFTVGLSFEVPPNTTQDLGDLVSLWDAKTRQGFTLGLRNNTGVTSSQPNWRQLQFGIDAGTEPSWRDEGRPGSAILGFSIAVHDGKLYVGTCEIGENPVGQVYRYDGPDKWVPVGTLDGSNSVTALATFEGQLYAATGKYRLAGSALEESKNSTRGGKVYRFVRPGEWELVGDLAPTEAIAGLVVYDGKLYASSVYKPAGFFRYEGGQKWTSLPTPEGRRVNALAVHGGMLYATSYDGGAIARFDGTKWQDLGNTAADVTQNYSFATYQNVLQVGAWPTGKVYSLDAQDNWLDQGRMGEELEVMGLLVHNGVFYGGTLPKAEVYRYDGDARWTLLRQLDETPDVKYRRVWGMATYQGRLFVTTLPSGKVWSMSSGAMVTDDRELGSGWHDIVAERSNGKLRLLVDGKLAAEAEAADLNLATENVSLKVGEGPRGRFPGEMKNVWFKRKSRRGFWHASIFP
jgi:hypothetical protein